MKLVYDFDFSKAAKKAETLINECVRKKEGRAFTKIYANINGRLFEINKPVSLYVYQILRTCPHRIKIYAKACGYAK